MARHIGTANLKPIKDSERAKELQKKAAEKQRENIAKRKTLKEELLLLLSQGNTQEKISLALIQKALNGDTKAFEVIRDSIGEKQTDKIEQSGEINNTITVKLAGDIQEWGK